MIILDNGTKEDGSQEVEHQHDHDGNREGVSHPGPHGFDLGVVKAKVLIVKVIPVHLRGALDSSLQYFQHGRVSVVKAERSDNVDESLFSLLFHLDSVFITEGDEILQRDLARSRTTPFSRDLSTCLEKRFAHVLGNLDALRSRRLNAMRELFDLRLS